MRVFVVGATGVIGCRLVSLLVAAGHEVIGTTRTADKGELLQKLGATPTAVDAFDRAKPTRAVREAHPDVIIKQPTDLGAVNLPANAHAQGRNAQPD